MEFVAGNNEHKKLKNSGNNDGNYCKEIMATILLAISGRQAALPHTAP